MEGFNVKMMSGGQISKKRLGGKIIQSDDYYPDGECPHVTVYEADREEIVIYDADGRPMVRERFKMGFDLSGK